MSEDSDRELHNSDETTDIDDASELDNVVESGPSSKLLSAIESVTDELGRLNFRLRSRAQLSLFLTLINFATFAVGYPSLLISVQDVSSSSLGYRDTTSLQLVGLIFTVLLVFSVTVTLAALLLLGTLESSNKRAEAIFQELSDQMQRFHGRTLTDEADALLASSRFTIRSYARAGDLAFVPGKYGAGIYALANIIFGSASVILGVLVYTSALQI